MSRLALWQAGLSDVDREYDLANTFVIVSIGSIEADEELDVVMV
jgi:hypothetical protein